MVSTRLELLTGKGGVGRSTLALSLARAAAQRGERVLLLEAEEGPERAAALGRLLGLEPSGAPKLVESRLSVAQLRAAEGHESFLRGLIPAGPLIRAALGSRPLRRFLESAPAMYELGLFQQLWSFLQDGAFDRIVLDLPATGHALALLQLPDQLRMLLQKGPLVDRLMRGKVRVGDPQLTRIWIVTRPAPTIISEALELEEQLRIEGLSCAGFLLNGWSTLKLDAHAEEIAEELLREYPESDEAQALSQRKHVEPLLRGLHDRAALWTLPQLIPSPLERPPPAWYQPLVDALIPLLTPREEL